MKNTERYRHLRVDWVGQSITLCAVEGEDIGAGQALWRYNQKLWMSG